MSSKKAILVTGSNDGIGKALSKLLLSHHNCKVFMCSRSLDRGEKSLADVKSSVGPGADVELLQLDVCDPSSISSAASKVRDSGVKLYALVNNAGVGFNATNGDVIQTNFYGPKLVTEAFVDLIEENGRVVNVSSGAASMWLRNQDNGTKQLFKQEPVTSWEKLEEGVKGNFEGASMGGYGLTGLTAYTIQQSVLYPNLTCTSLSPGFIATKMTSGFGARLTPEQGTVSLIKCLFGEVTSGWYFGSDGLRSPLTVARDPGTPEYGGEENPDASRYNN